MFLRLAFRNIFRSRMRTLITLLMIGSGSTAMIIASGFIEDTVRQVREATIRDLLGHLRIYKKGFLTDGLIHPYDYMIPDIPTMMTQLSAEPHVVALGPRLSYFGLISNGDTTLPFSMQAFDPARENRNAQHNRYDGRPIHHAGQTVRRFARRGPGSRHGVARR